MLTSLLVLLEDVLIISDVFFWSCLLPTFYLHFL